MFLEVAKVNGQAYPFTTLETEKTATMLSEVEFVGAQGLEIALDVGCADVFQARR